MTNEEKAVGIGLHVRDVCISKGVTRDNAETASLLVQQSAMEMAKWKDQQFKEYLEKKKNNYMCRREMWQQDTFEWSCYDAQIDTIDEIINELFKE